MTRQPLIRLSNLQIPIALSRSGFSCFFLWSTTLNWYSIPTLCLSFKIVAKPKQNMVNRYSHAIVLSYYESRGWITLPPAFQSPFVSLPHYTPPPQPPPHPHGNEPISSIRYHRPAPFARRGRHQPPVTDPSTPRSTTPPPPPLPRAQARTASIPSTTTTRASLKPTRPGPSLQRPTPSIITEIFDPDSTYASAAAAAAPARQDAQSPPGSQESPHQRISTLTNYDCPSPTSTIFNLLGPLSSLQDDRDDLDYTPPLTNSGSSVSSSSRLEPATPSFSESPTDSHDSPILKPFDDFVPAFDDFSRYATDTGSPWHDPASPTAPTIFRLPPVDLSIHPALRGHPPPPPPPPPPMEEEYGEDDAIPPPIARHRRTGPAKLTKVDRSAMSFLKQQPAGDPLSSSKRHGGEYYYAIGNSEPPAIPLNVASMRQAAPRSSKGRQDYQMGTAAAAAGPDAVEQLPIRGNHNALSDWLKGNRSKR